MRHVTAVLVRTAVLASVLALYTWGVAATADPGGAGGANIGAGLIAFAGLVVSSGVWALVDSHRHGVRPAILWWGAVAVVLALGWWIVFAVTQRDSTMSFTDVLASDAGFIPFVIVMVLVPAAIGASLGAVSGRGRVRH